MMKQTFSLWESQLPAGLFVKVSRSLLVYTQSVAKMERKNLLTWELQFEGARGYSLGVSVFKAIKSQFRLLSLGTFKRNPTLTKCVIPPSNRSIETMMVWASGIVVISPSLDMKALPMNPFPKSL